MNILWIILTRYFIFSSRSIYKYDGHDTRNITETSDINKIIVMFEKKTLLDNLQNNRISQYDKITMINKHYDLNKIKPYNLNMDKLFDEFNSSDF